MSKLQLGWLVFTVLVVIALFTVKISEDQYPGYTSMVSKGIYKDHVDKEEKSHGTHNLDLSKYRPKL